MLARPALPAGQHRPAQHAQLRALAAQAVHDRRRAQGLRRPARRGVLRRPRQHLRPRHAATVRAAAPDPDGRPRRGQRDAGPERAHDRHPGTDPDLTRDGSTDRPTSRRPVRHRRLGLGQPPAVTGHRRPHRQTGGPFVQVSRLGNPLFNEVLVPMAQKDRWNARPPRRQIRQVRRQPGARRPAARALPRRVPEPGGLQEAAGRPAGHPADGYPGRRRPGLPELHRHGAGRHAAAQHGHPARGEARTDLGLSAATRPASRTAAASSTTSSLSSCGRSPGRPSRSSTRPTRRTPQRSASPTGRSNTERSRHRTIPLLGDPGRRVSDHRAVADTVSRRGEPARRSRCRPA